MNIFKKPDSKPTVQVVVVKDDDIKHPTFKGNALVTPNGTINLDFTLSIVLTEESEYGLAATYDVYIKPKGKK